MKKVVLLCIMMAALCCMAYADVNAPGYEAAKIRYWQLIEKVVDGSATSGEEAEFSDICQVYGFEVPVTEPVEPYDPENRDHSSLDGGADCASATVIECPFEETVAMDGDNDCSLVSAAPYSDLFYQFTPAVTGRYQFRVRHYNGGTSNSSIRIVKGACCTSGTTVGRAYSSNAIATDCPRPDSVGNEPSTCVAYLNAKLSQDTTYWIQIGTSSNLAVTTNIKFNMWCIERPAIEEPQLHNTCADAYEIACNDSLWGDSALWTNAATWDWYKIIIPDYSPDICSLRVFVGGRETGHYLSGLYNMTQNAYDGYPVDGRFSIWKEREGEFCVIDSVIGGYGYDDGCSYDAVRTILTTPGTYYIKVANDNNYEYVLKTNCATYSSTMACCHLDGNCTDVTAPECIASGGWTKPGVICSSDPCPTSACPYDALDNEETNNVCGEDVPTVVCDGWYCGVIPAVSDTDWYKIEVPEGVCETLRVDIYGNDTPSQWPYNQGLDPYVEIWSADCLTRLAYNYDANGVDPNPVLDDSRVQYKIKLQPGWYYIKVRSEMSSVGPYVMHVSCITYECPDLTGDTCDPARVVTFDEFGVYLDTRSTCDFTDNYRPTCVGSYGNGPDVIYSIELDGNTCFACSLFALGNTGGSPYGKVAVFANCPTDAAEPCLAQSVSNYVGPYGFICQGPYAAGTYYIMVDNYAPGPDCINYTLKVFTCACPTPCPYDNRDTEPNDACAETVPAIACNESLCGVISTSTDVDWYQLVIPEGVCDSVTIEAFANDTPTEWPYGRGLESYLNLYKSDCVTQIAYNDDRGGSPYNDDAKIGKVYLKSGTYYIKVSRGGYTTSEIGPYVLRVTCETAECPLPCEEYVLCGLPGEVEVNNTCPPPVEQAEVTCAVPVYGLHCPYTDVDYWKVTVPPQSVMTVKLYTGPLCAINPPAGAALRHYDDACLTPTTATGGAATFKNLTDLPLVKYLEVYDVGESQVLYKIEATCCAIKNYCFDPIDIQDGPTSFDMTVNTCCASRAVDSVRSQNCATGTWYDSGPSVLVKFGLRYNALVNITVTGITMTDVQFMVFTDCLHSAATCVASRDYSSPEVLTGLSLPAGTYYIAVMVYDGSLPYDNCGDIRIQIDSDVPLPVNMLGDVVATAGDGKVTLNWATASENNNDRFEIVRDNRVVGLVTGAGTSPSQTDYTWTDSDLNNNTTYTYKLRSVTTNGTVTELATVSATPSFAAGAVTEYALHQNYPNPFNPTTSLAFDLVESGFVTLKVYNLMGQEVKTVVSSTMDAGRHIVSFDASNLSSGLYLYRVEVNGFAAEKKMLLMK